jgi:hypothetical protein
MDKYKNENIINDLITVDEYVCLDLALKDYIKLFRESKQCTNE